MISKNVLVIDDEAPIRETIKQIVLTLNSSEIDVKVDTAKDGLDGLMAIKGKKYDLVISDYKMPFIDGNKLVEALLFYENPNKRTSLLLVTGLPEMVALRPNDRVTVISKPIIPQKLLRNVRIYLFAENLKERFN